VSTVEIVVLVLRTVLIPEIAPLVLVLQLGLFDLVLSGVLNEVFIIAASFIK